MFFRLKKSGERAYVQIVENKRVGGAVRQSVTVPLHADFERPGCRRQRHRLCDPQWPAMEGRG